MHAIRECLARLHVDRRGVTALEYALVGTLIAVAIIASLTRVANSLSGVFGTISAHL